MCKDIQRLRCAPYTADHSASPCVPPVELQPPQTGMGHRSCSTNVDIVVMERRSAGSLTARKMTSRTMGKALREYWKGRGCRQS